MEHFPIFNTQNFPFRFPSRNKLPERETRPCFPLNKKHFSSALSSPMAEIMFNSTDSNTTLELTQENLIQQISLSPNQINHFILPIKRRKELFFQNIYKSARMHSIPINIHKFGS
jgi:hypothetical protein